MSLLFGIMVASAASLVGFSYLVLQRQWWIRKQWEDTSDLDLSEPELPLLPYSAFAEPDLSSCLSD